MSKVSIVGKFIDFRHVGTLNGGIDTHMNFLTLILAVKNTINSAMQHTILLYFPMHESLCEEIVQANKWTGTVHLIIGVSGCICNHVGGENMVMYALFTCIYSFIIIVKVLLFTIINI